MRTIGTLVILFLIAGFAIPFLTPTGYTQNGTEAECECEAIGELDIPCTHFSGEGYIFQAYLVNVQLTREGTRIPSCPKQIRTETSTSFSFMEWPSNVNVNVPGVEIN